MDISVVIPIKDEEDNIKPLLKSIEHSLESFKFEVIFVDDGSTDNSVAVIKKLNSKSVKLISLRKNYGQSISILAGIKEAKGKFIVTMDGDLQNDPSDIPMMLDTLNSKKCDVVIGRRVDRKDGFFLRKLPSKIANFIIRSFTNVHMRDYGCALKVFRSKSAKNLDLYGELHRFIPVLLKMEGAYMVEVDVKHNPRIHGNSKYGVGRTFKVISDLLLLLFMKKYMLKPMHFFGTLGLLVFFIGLIINGYLLALKLLGEDIGQRPLLMLGVTMVLIGLQFITIGFIAEVIMRVYYSGENKPSLYLVKEIFIVEDK